MQTDPEVSTDKVFTLCIRKKQELEYRMHWTSLPCVLVSYTVVPRVQESSHKIGGSWSTRHHVCTMGRKDWKRPKLCVH